MNPVFEMFLVFIGIVLICSVFWRSSRSQELLHNWAARNEVDIVKSERCYFFKGPYFWTAGKSQDVYEVWVRDKSDRQRHGFVCVGGFLLGMWSEHVEATFDD